MNTTITSCGNCGAPLPVVENQWVAECRACKTKLYIQRQTPPAVVIKPLLDENEAAKVVRKKLDHPYVSSQFARDATYKDAILYYIPFFEVRGVKTGTSTEAPGQPPGYSHESYELMEICSDLEDLGGLVFDFTFVEEALLHAEPAPFDPVALRQTGVVLPPHDLQILLKKERIDTMGSVEHYKRLVYFPVWEIVYSHNEILFKSYISAVDGRVIKLQALRNHNKKLMQAFIGLASFAILLGRGINSGGLGFMLAALIVIPTSAVLMPFFWETFAFREMVEFHGPNSSFRSLQYTENSFAKFSRKLLSKVLPERE